MAAALPDLFPYALEFLLSNETFTRNGQTISLYQDDASGECSNFGISLAWFRGLKPHATADDIKALTREGCEHLYRVYFWEPAHLSAITLPTVAARVFDLEVNMGSPHGIRVLQRALGIEDDGVLGPVTVAACNTTNECCLYGAVVREAANRYQAIHDHQIVEYTPKIGAQRAQGLADRNMAGWLDRLGKKPGAWSA